MKKKSTAPKKEKTMVNPNEKMLLARIKRPKKLRPTVEAIAFKYGLEVQEAPQEVIDLEDGKREEP